MRVFIVRPTITDSGTLRSYGYPDEWLRLASEGSGRIVGWNRGLDDPVSEQIAVVDDGGDVAALLADDRFQEVTESEANELGVQWMPEMEVISDPQAVLDALRSVPLQALPPKVRAVLDPTDPTAGVTRKGGWKGLS